MVARRTTARGVKVQAWPEEVGPDIRGDKEDEREPPAVDDEEGE